MRCFSKNLKKGYIKTQSLKAFAYSNNKTQDLIYHQNLQTIYTSKQLEIDQLRTIFNEKKIELQLHHNQTKIIKHYYENIKTISNNMTQKCLSLKKIKKEIEKQHNLLQDQFKETTKKIQSDQYQIQFIYRQIQYSKQNIQANSNYIKYLLTNQATIKAKIQQKTNIQKQFSYKINQPQSLIQKQLTLQNSYLGFYSIQYHESKLIHQNQNLINQIQKTKLLIEQKQKIKIKLQGVINLIEMLEQKLKIKNENEQKKIEVLLEKNSKQRQKKIQLNQLLVLQKNKLQYLSIQSNLSHKISDIQPFSNIASQNKLSNQEKRKKAIIKKNNVLFTSYN